MDSDPVSLLQVLEDRRLPGLELRLLLCAVTGATRVELVTQGERRIDPGQRRQLEELVRRRLAGEPMAYLLGEREFFGRPFRVSPAVLIPRPETEQLVELALERMGPGATVLDLGTGSGVIAITLACERPDAQISACDISEDAIELARSNGQRLGARVNWQLSDWFAGMGMRRFDLLVSNPPYIAATDPHLTQGDLRFEPRLALTDETDGLKHLRTLVQGARSFLASQGWLLVEHGYNQAGAVRELMNTAGFSDVQSWRDLAGIERVSGGRGPLIAD